MQKEASVPGMAVVVVCSWYADAGVLDGCCNNLRTYVKGLSIRQALPAALNELTQPIDPWYK